MSGRYDGQAQLAVPQDDGTTRPMSTPRVSVQPATDVVYPVREGDRLDLLAGAALGDSTAGGSSPTPTRAPTPLDLERTGTPLAVPNA